MRILYLMGAFLLILGLILGSFGCATPSQTPTPTSKPAPVTTPTTPTTIPSASPKPTAEAPADFYKKNTLTLVVPWAAGGGTDFAARVWAIFWPDVTEGTIRVKNVAGADGHAGRAEVYSAKPDGLTIGLENQYTLVYDQIANNPNRKYDAAKFNYLGWFGYQPYVFSISAGSRYKTLDEVRQAKGLKFATTGGSTTPAAATVIYMLGLDAKVIVFPSAGDVQLAGGRGEIDLMSVQADTMKDFIDKGYFKKPLAYLSAEKGQLFPDVQAISDLVKLSDDAMFYLKTWDTLMGGRTVFAPPGLPNDRLAFLRDAFNKIMQDKGFASTSKARFGPTEPPKAGQEIADKVTKLLSMPKADQERYTNTLQSVVKK